MDPGLPDERVRYLLDDARPALVLDEEALRAVPADLPDTDPVDADYRLVTGNYFHALRIPLRSGRSFFEFEEHPGAPVAVVNEEFVRRYLGGRDPLGVTVRMNDSEGDITVVGVAPGAVWTPIDEVTLSDPKEKAKLEAAIPIGRVAQPQEIANVVAFLASDAASYGTAATYTVDGGMMQASVGL